MPTQTDLDVDVAIAAIKDKVSAAVTGAVTEVNTKVASDREADRAEVMAAIAARDAALADDASDKAKQAELIAVLKSKGFNPDGSVILPTDPPPVDPPPAGTWGPPVFVNGNVEVPFKDVGTPTKIGRDGTDATGYGDWDTSQTPGKLDEFIAAKKATFTGMNVPGANFTFSLTKADGSVMLTTITIPAPTNPNPVPTTGKMKIGIFTYGDPGGPAQMSSLIQHPVQGIGYFQRILDGAHDLNDRFVPFLKQNPGNILDTCLQPSTWDNQWPGFNGDRNWIYNECRNWARHIQQLGIAKQTLARLMGEVNATWFPWGNNAAWYKEVANGMIDAIKSEAPDVRVVLNVVPGRAGSPNAGAGNSADPEAFWTDKHDGVSMDHYMWVLSGGTPKQVADSYFAHSRSDIWAAKFTKDRGKFWTMSETATAQPGGPTTGEMGDNGAALRYILDGLVGAYVSPSGAVVQPPLCWLYENVPDGNVNTNLQSNPSCVSTLVSFCNDRLS